MKIVTFYLPQFHEIPENNDAWGNGFTEWTNVRKAVPYFEGHNQPREPLNNNYYNLLDDKVLKWQSRLANEVGIYGFCFYHYWFEGRMVLQKPAENLLANKDINLNFCFSWANEPWTKTWHGASGNKEILIPQTYGGKEEWEKHYLYFRHFFMDNRYMKEENRPILVIYKLKNIPNFNQMIKYWNECARKDGFDGMYIISMNVGDAHVDKSIWVNASVDFEPFKARNALRANAYTEEISFMDYDAIYKKAFENRHEKNHYRGMFVDFDDSPRRGKRGIVAKGASPQKFGEYLKKTIELSEIEGNDYIFINGWNEWGEGNYLEPDTHWEYQYLQNIKEALH